MPRGVVVKPLFESSPQVDVVRSPLALPRWMWLKIQDVADSETIRLKSEAKVRGENPERIGKLSRNAVIQRLLEKALKDLDADEETQKRRQK